MSELTKQQLRNELVSHGVKLPSPTAKKSEYVKIYEKYVAPVARSKGDFSSDDEDLPVNDVKAQVSLDTSHLMINGLDITHLDDDELYARLKDLGSPVGPVVDTTRSVYQKKLFVLLGGHLPDTPTFNGDVDQEEDEEEYSDSEPEVVADTAKQTHNRVVTQSSRTMTFTSTAAAASASSPAVSHFTDARRRVVLPSGGGVTDSSEIVYDPDLHTPSPRRSLRTVSSSTSETTSYRRMVNNGKTSSSSRYITTGGMDIVDSPPGPGKVSSVLRLLVKLLFLALLIAIALYFYQNNPTESPFKAIEEMARQALEAAAGEKVTVSHEDVDQPDALPPPKQPEVTN